MLFAVDSRPAPKDDPGVLPYQVIVAEITKLVTEFKEKWNAGQGHRIQRSTHPMQGVHACFIGCRLLVGPIDVVADTLQYALWPLALGLPNFVTLLLLHTNNPLGRLAGGGRNTEHRAHG